MALIVCRLQGQLRSVEMVVGEVVAAEVVQEGSALGGWVERKRRRLLVYQGEYLLRASKLSAVEEEFQAEVCHQVDTYPAPFRLTIAVETRDITTSLAGTFLEGFADEVR